MFVFTVLHTFTCYAWPSEYNSNSKRKTYRRMCYDNRHLFAQMQLISSCVCASWCSYEGNKHIHIDRNAYSNRNYVSSRSELNVMRL